MEPKKNIFASKTFWLNAITTLTAIAGVLPPNKYTLSGLSLLNIGLRIITTQPVTLSNTKE